MKSANAIELFWVWSYSTCHDRLSIAVLKLSETHAESKKGLKAKQRQVIMSNC